MSGDVHIGIAYVDGADLLEFARWYAVEYGEPDCALPVSREHSQRLIEAGAVMRHHRIKALKAARELVDMLSR